MKSVNVLLRSYQIEHLLLLYVLRERQLNKYPAYLLGLLHPLDALHDLLLSGVLSQVIPLILDPHLITRLLLQPDIQLGLHVIPHDHIPEHRPLIVLVLFT